MQQQATILKPVASEIYSGSNLEPQYVTSKHPVTSYLYLSSEDLPPSTDKTNCIVRPDRGFGQFGQNFNRMSVAEANILFNTPNVNPRNDLLVLVTASNSYPLTLIDGYYSTGSSVIAMILSLLNSSGSGITFTDTVGTTPNTYVITGSAAFYFNSTASTAITNGFPMFNVDQSQVLQTAHTIGPMNLFYTTYIDVCSIETSRWLKMQPGTSGPKSPVLVRIFLQTSWGLTYYKVPYYSAFSWNSDNPLSYLDIAMYDEFGLPLYVPSNGNNIGWQLSLLLEK
jgi:hypothetical protein